MHDSNIGDSKLKRLARFTHVKDFGLMFHNERLLREKIEFSAEMSIILTYMGLTRSPTHSQIAQRSNRTQPKYRELVYTERAQSM